MMDYKMRNKLKLDGYKQDLYNLTQTEVERIIKGDSYDIKNILKNNQVKDNEIYDDLMYFVTKQDIFRLWEYCQSQREIGKFSMEDAMKEFMACEYDEKLGYFSSYDRKSELDFTKIPFVTIKNEFVDETFQLKQHKGATKEVGNKHPANLYKDAIKDNHYFNEFKSFEIVKDKHDWYVRVPLDGDTFMLIKSEEVIDLLEKYSVKKIIKHVENSEKEEKINELIDNIDSEIQKDKDKEEMIEIIENLFSL